MSERPWERVFRKEAGNFKPSTLCVNTMDDVSVEYVKDLVVTQQKTHSEVSLLLKEAYPNRRGLSLRSVRRFCLKNGIHAQSRLSNDELEQCTKEIVARVGPTWGRKMVKGYMASCGITAGDKRIARALSVVSPLYQIQRNFNTARQTNPFPYSADYFGHKLHMDQNEKLTMYGLTEVSACDGYSGKIVAFATMPVKNNVLIYEHIYRTAVIQHGIWDQLRVDHGTEFYLSLYVQEKLAPYRTNTRRVPFIQTTSKQNHPAERKWVEFNTRVNYPIKRALNAMVNEDLIDMDDDMNKFCVSWFTSRTADIGIKQVICSWNNHPIPGRGVPDKRMEENKKTFILPSIDMLPTSEEAILAYEREDGHLSLPEVFGTDLLSGNQQLQKLRFDNFNAAYPSFDVIFHCLVNGNYYPFKEGLQYFIDLTTTLNPN